MPDTNSDHPGLPKHNMGLCLSGGGYRAMLFHVGALWRLNQLGLLAKLDRISSVSGGSIAAGLLALKWEELGLTQHASSTNFEATFVDSIRAVAAQTIDKRGILKGIFSFKTIAEVVAENYDTFLFRGATLKDLPATPRFVINATNVQTGALWRFSKPYMRDYRVGKIENPSFSLATAVAASSAFPPLLSPMVIELDPGAFVPGSGHDLQKEPYTRRAVLSDGGVYDNLGLETVQKNHRVVFVSDGGGKLPPQGKPKQDWLRHSKRIIDVIDNQVRSLRKRVLIDAYELTEPPQLARDGAYWGIRTKIDNYKLADALPAPYDVTIELSNVATRLKKLPDELQERLINWGYAVCDAAVRKHFDPSNQPPAQFPYAGGVGG